LSVTQVGDEERRRPGTGEDMIASIVSIASIASIDASGGFRVPYNEPEAHPGDPELFTG
jgi:hypothetical protein